MSGSATYLDASAFVKLALPEAETAALRQFLSTRGRHVSSLLLRAEAIRAARRSNSGWVPKIRELLSVITLIPLDEDLIESAAMLAPAELRTLDALHLATAMRLGTDLREIVTYDARMAAAAASLGLTVAAPA